MNSAIGPGAADQSFQRRGCRCSNLREHRLQDRSDGARGVGETGAVDPDDGAAVDVVDAHRDRDQPGTATFAQERQGSGELAALRITAR